MRKGAAAVEFALIAPVFAIFLMGMLEYGRAIQVQQIVTNASREGARVGVLPGKTNTDVTTAVSNYLGAAGITGFTVGTQPEQVINANPGDAVQVSVTADFDVNCWFPPMLVQGDPIGTTTMRKEN